MPLGGTTHSKQRLDGAFAQTCNAARRETELQAGHLQAALGKFLPTFISIVSTLKETIVNLACEPINRKAFACWVLAHATRGLPIRQEPQGSPGQPGGPGSQGTGKTCFFEGGATPPKKHPQERPGTPRSPGPWETLPRQGLPRWWLVHQFPSDGHFEVATNLN